MVSTGTRSVGLWISFAHHSIGQLTTDPSGYRPSGQESHNIRRKVITVELDQMVCVWIVQVLEREEVIVECVLINLGISTIDNLCGLTVVRLSWDGFKNSLSKEDFSTEYNY